MGLNSLSDRIGAFILTYFAGNSNKFTQFCEQNDTDLYRVPSLSKMDDRRLGASEVAAPEYWHNYS
jgi:hypothetical protein